MVMSDWPFEVQMSFVLAVTTYGAIMDSTLAPLYSDRVLKEILRRGWWGEETPYFEEMARFLEDHGQRGLPPGAFRWAFLNWGIYYSMWVVAVAFSFAVLGILGGWTPFAFAALATPLFLFLYVSNGRRVKALYREARDYGFRLDELSPSMQRFRAHRAERTLRRAERGRGKAR